MRPYNAQEIQEAFDKLPEEVRSVITSPDIHDAIQALAQKYALHIDQIGELMDEVGLVLLNLHSSVNFVTVIAQRMSVSSKTAYDISRDINSAVFDKIRDHLKQQTEAERPVEEHETNTVSSLERVGGFSIDQPTTEPERKPVTAADRGSILAGLENPPTSTPAPTNNPPTNLPTSTTNSSNPVPRTLPSQPKQEEKHVEPLVDYLLSNSVGQATKTVSAQRTPGAPDAYREPIN